MRAPRTFRTRLYRVVLSVACAVTLSPAHAAAQTGETRRPRQATRRWRVPTYKGITLNRSTRRDVRKIFGKPDWSGHPEDERDNAIPHMLRDEFVNVGGFGGRVAVNMRKRGTVVYSIEVYPPDDRQPLFDDVVAEFGGDYIERDTALGPCPTAAELRAHEPPAERDSLVFRVYPHKGYYITVVRSGHVREIVFLSKCP